MYDHRFSEPQWPFFTPPFCRHRQNMCSGNPAKRSQMKWFGILVRNLHKCFHVLEIFHQKEDLRWDQKSPGSSLSSVLLTIYFNLCQFNFQSLILDSCHSSSSKLLQQLLICSNFLLDVKFFYFVIELILKLKHYSNSCIKKTNIQNNTGYRIYLLLVTDDNN